MGKTKKYYKLFDEKLAAVIADGGFSYITEKTTEGQSIYVFEQSCELDAFIRETNLMFASDDHPPCIEDDIIVV